MTATQAAAPEAAAGAAAPALIGHDLVVEFAVPQMKRKLRALDRVSLEVPAGALSAIVGPDGAGKTTLIRLATGLLRCSAGTLRVLGIDVAAEPQAVQDRIGYMPQRFGLYEDLSVQENLDLYADLHGVSADYRGQRYRRLMEMTDLGRFTGRLAGKLSGGMKQKLGLACTLVRSPQLLLLDEPTVGVDPLSRRELWQIVEQLTREEKLTVLVNTAYLDEAEHCERVFLLQQGRILFDGPPSNLRAQAEGRCFVATPEAGEPARRLQSRLLDDRARIVDAVPVAGEVRFVLRTANQPAAQPRSNGADAAAADAEERRALDPAAQGPMLAEAIKARRVEPRLEDGFMVLLAAQAQALATDAPAPASPPSPPTPTSHAKYGANTASGDPVIDVHELSRKFGDFTAVRQTTFSVQRGEVFGLLGPNGAGKTTTFRMLCGLLPPSSGSLRVAGVDMRHSRAAARRRIGYVSQKFALYGNLSVIENLHFFAGAYGLRGGAAKRRVADSLDEFDLGAQADAASGQLPGGYRQRLAMAAALLHEPEILFLDEPTSGADPQARREFWRRITLLAEQQTTVVVTTHFMEEAEYCDRILIQDAGAVLALGTPREVRHQAAKGPAGAAASTMEQAFIEIVERARARDHADATGAER